MGKLSASSSLKYLRRLETKRLSRMPARRGLSMTGLWPHVRRQSPHEKYSEEFRPSLGPRHVMQLKLPSPYSGVVHRLDKVGLIFPTAAQEWKWLGRDICTQAGNG